MNWKSTKQPKGDRSSMSVDDETRACSEARSTLLNFKNSVRTRRTGLFGSGDEPALSVWKRATQDYQRLTQNLSEEVPKSTFSFPEEIVERLAEIATAVHTIEGVSLL